uniref:hypothetical protein n=1 Tax=Paraburkholderia sp. SG-MS1 TaxID=2023741 RepID=UPI001EEC4B57|nr:hypothetical protein [Paraburkholderia sp. SG-MS1]
METVSLGLPFHAAFLDRGACGPKFAQAMDQYAYTAAMWIVGEDMPRDPRGDRSNGLVGCASF